MKIQRPSATKRVSEPSDGTKEITETILEATSENLLATLEAIKEPPKSKDDFYHWIEVFDRFDDIYGCYNEPDNAETDDKYNLKIFDPKDKAALVIQVLRVSAVVLETRVNKNLAQYNSLEHLHAMIASDNLLVVIGALEVLLSLGRHRNKLNTALEKDLQGRLASLAQGWGLSEYKIDLVSCCFDDIEKFPKDVTRLNCEFFLTDKHIASLEEPPASMTPGLVTISEPLVDAAARPTQVLRALVNKYHVPLVHQFELIARIKLCQSLPTIVERQQCLKIRLVAFTVLLLSHAEPRVFAALFEKDPTIIPELVELVGTTRCEIPTNLKIVGFRMLQAFVQATMKVQQVIDSTGAAVQHGFLPQLLQRYTTLLQRPVLPDDVPLTMVTSVFTLVQLLCNYQPGVDALVASDTIKVLVPIIQNPIVHVKFSTRSARILEMILHMSQNGQQRFIDALAVEAFVARLEADVAACTPQCRPGSVGFYTKDKKDVRNVLEGLLTATVGEQVTDDCSGGNTEMELSGDVTSPIPTSSTQQDIPWAAMPSTAPLEVCVAERKSLLKSLLKFLLSVAQEPAFATPMRTVIGGSILNSLEIIIRNPQFYGTTLWSSASKWVTEFVNNEPNLLSVVQDAGIHEAILEVLKHNPPPCADILADLPSLLSAICLNDRGLALFQKFKPLDCLIQIFSSPTYLPHINNDTASALGGSLDELLRHQPTLAEQGIDAVVAVFQSLTGIGADDSLIVVTGSDHMLRKYERKARAAQQAVDARESVLQPAVSIAEAEPPSASARRNLLSRGAPRGAAMPAANHALGFSADGMLVSAAQDAAASAPADSASAALPAADVPVSPDKDKLGDVPSGGSKKSVQLLDYMSNSLRFLEHLFTNSANVAHAKKFDQRDGLQLLLRMYSMPNLPKLFRFSTASSILAAAYRALGTSIPERAISELAFAIIRRLADITEALADAEMTEGTIKAMSVVAQHVELISAVTTDCFTHGHNETVTGFWSSESGVDCAKKLSWLNTKVLVKISEGTLRQAAVKTGKAPAESAAVTARELDDGEDVPSSMAVDDSSFIDLTSNTSAQRVQQADSDPTSELGILQFTQRSIEGLFSNILRVASGRRHQLFSAGDSMSQPGKIIVRTMLGLLITSLKDNIEQAQQKTEDVFVHIAVVSLMVGQIDSFMSESSRGRGTDRKAQKLLPDAVMEFGKQGGTKVLLDAMTWTFEKLERVRSGGSSSKFVANSQKMISQLGTRWKILPNKPVLTIADANVVHANGGGAWVCDYCQGKSEGRFTFHCKEVDFDICPWCTEMLAQAPNDRAYFEAIKKLLVLTSRILDPVLTREAKSSLSKPLLEMVGTFRNACVPVIKVLWDVENISKCDHGSVQSLLHLVNNMLLGEKQDAELKALPSDASRIDSAEGGFASMLRAGGQFSGALSGGLDEFARLFAREPAPEREPAPPPPPVVAHPDSLQVLQDMGFGQHQARRALVMTNNNLEGAAELILNGGIPDEPDPAADAPATATPEAAAADAPADDSAVSASTPAPNGPEDPSTENTDGNEDDDEGEGNSEEEMLARAIAMSIAGGETSDAAEDDSSDAEDENDAAAAMEIAVDSTDAASAADVAGSQASDIAAEDPAVEQASDIAAEDPAVEQAPAGSNAMATLVDALNSAQLGSRGGAAGASEAVQRVISALQAEASRSTSAAQTNSSANVAMAAEEGDPKAVEPSAVQGLRDDIMEVCVNVLDNDFQQIFNVKPLLMMQLGDADDRSSGEDAISTLLDQILDLTGKIQQFTAMDDMVTSPLSLQLYPRVHLAVILMSEQGAKCASLMSARKVVPTLIKLVTLQQQLLAAKYTDAPPTITGDAQVAVSPLWFAPMVLLVDLYANISTSLRNDSKARIECVLLGTGKWEQCRPPGYNSGYPSAARIAWEPYSETDSKNIEQAFAELKPSVEITRRGHPVKLVFSRMEEISVDGPQRANQIRRVLRWKPDGRPEDADPAAAEAAEAGAAELPAEIAEDDYTALTVACASVLSLRLDQESLEAIMRLLTRVTQKHSLALAFVEAKGLDAILHLRNGSSNRVTELLTVLLVRHALEDKDAMMEMMKQQITSKLSGRTMLTNHLSALAPVLCRDMATFSDAACQVLQLADMTEVDRDFDDMKVVAKKGADRNKKPLPASDGLRLVVRMLRECLVSRLDSNCGMSECPEDADKAKWKKDHGYQVFVLQPYKVLQLLTELVRSFPAAVPLIAAETFPGDASVSTGESNFFWFLVTKVILRPNLLEVSQTSGRRVKAEMQWAGRLLTAVAGSSNNGAQRSITKYINLALTQVQTARPSETRSAHIIALSDLIFVMITKSKSSSGPGIASLMAEEQLQNQLVDLVSALDINNPDVGREMNAVLKPLELLSRFAKPVVAAVASASKSSSPATADILLASTPTDHAASAIDAPPVFVNSDAMVDDIDIEAAEFEDEDGPGAIELNVHDEQDDFDEEGREDGYEDNMDELGRDTDDEDDNADGSGSDSEEGEDDEEDDDGDSDGDDDDDSEEDGEDSSDEEDDGPGDDDVMADDEGDLGGDVVMRDDGAIVNIDGDEYDVIGDEPELGEFEVDDGHLIGNNHENLIAAMEDAMDEEADMEDQQMNGDPQGGEWGDDMYDDGDDAIDDMLDHGDHGNRGDPLGAVLQDPNALQWGSNDGGQSHAELRVATHLALRIGQQSRRGFSRTIMMHNSDENPEGVTDNHPMLGQQQPSEPGPGPAGMHDIQIRTGRHGGNVITLPIDPSQLTGPNGGYTPMLARTLAALHMPNASHPGMVTMSSEDGSSGLNDFRIFSQPLEVVRRMESMFGSNAGVQRPDNAGSDSADRLNSECRLLFGRPLSVSVYCVHLKVGMFLYRQGKFQQAQEQLKAAEQAMVSADKVKAEAEERGSKLTNSRVAAPILSTTSSTDAVQGDDAVAPSNDDALAPVASGSESTATVAATAAATADEPAEPATISILGVTTTESATDAASPADAHAVVAMVSDPDIASVSADDAAPSPSPGPTDIPDAMPAENQADTARDEEPQPADTSDAAASAVSSNAADAPAADTPAADAPAADAAAADAAATDAPAADASAAADAPTAESAAAAAPPQNSAYEEEFLAALPPELRAEVMAQQQLEQQQAQVSVPAEFLAALPPELQREVIEQEVREQRQRTPQPSQGSPVAEAMSPASIIASLAPDLRTEVLMEHSHDDAFLAQLPDNLREEALRLRRSRERRLRAQYDMEGHGGPRAAPPSSVRGGARSHRGATAPPPRPKLARDGRAVLDHARIVQLLRVFFAPHNLTTTVLNKTLANLCSHQRSRVYICSGLLSMLAKTGPEKLMDFNGEGGPPSSLQRLFFDKGPEGLQSRTPPRCARRVLDCMAELIVTSKKVEEFFIESVQVKYPTGMWDVFMSPGSEKPSTKGKDRLHKRKSSTGGAEATADSPMGALMGMLSHAEIVKNPQLMESLVSLISATASAIRKQQKANEAKATLEAKQKQATIVQQQLLAAKKSEDEKTNDVTAAAAASADKPSAADPKVDTKKDALPAPKGYTLNLALLENLVSVLRLSNCSSKVFFDITGVIEILSAEPENQRILIKSMAQIGQESEAELRKDFTSLTDEIATVVAGSVDSPTDGESGSAIKKLGALQTLAAKDSSQMVLLRILKTMSRLKKKFGKKDVKDAKKEAALAAVAAAAAAAANPTAAAAAASLATPANSDGDALTLGAAADAAASPAVNEQAGPASAAKEPTAKSTVDAFDEQVASLDLDSLWQQLGETIDKLQGYDTSNQMVMSLAPAIECLLFHHQARPEEQPSSTRASISSPDFLATFQGADMMDTSQSDLPTSSTSSTSPVGEKAFTFASFIDKHRVVLNKLVSTNPAALNEEPYSILIKYPNVIDFQVKESYFRYRLKKKQQSSRHNRIRLHINRNLLFHDSFRQLQGHRGRDLRGKIDVQFQGEEGVDAGGLLREWYYKLSHEMVNMNYALFEQSNIGSETYQPSTKSSINPEHLQFFKFCGRICAKGIFDNQLLDCHFTRAFYKQVLGVPVHWRDMEAVDEALYKNLMWITENDITGILDLNMTVDMDNFGAIETVELKPGGADIEVTETNKGEYVRLVCRQKLVLAIKDQMTNFLEGFYEVIPQSEIAIFNEKELEMVISGLPDVDVDDLKANTEYGSGYSPSSPQIQWFFRAVRTFGREENVRLVQFITGTGKIPVGGFAKLVGMSGPQKFNIHKDRNGADRLPQAHTCFNQLDLPEYESYDQLRKALLLAINEGSEGFGFA